MCITGYWHVRKNHEGADYRQERDRGMAEKVQWILDREGPDARAVVWAHNSHLAGHEVRGVTVLGSHRGGCAIRRHAALLCRARA